MTYIKYTNLFNVKVIILIFLIPGILQGSMAECGCKNSAQLPPALMPDSSALISPPSSDTGFEIGQNMKQMVNYSLPESQSGQCKPVRGNDVSSDAEVTWPSPLINSIYPDSVIAGSDTFTLTIGGNYYIPESRVYWDAHDYTKEYLSPYQITAEIPAFEIMLPGIHYIRVYNPSPCGGDSNIRSYQIRDNGQSFPLSTRPLALQALTGQPIPGVFLVQNPAKGLLRFNISLTKDSDSPFSFYFAEFPSWVSQPRVSIPDENHIILSGEDSSDKIRSGAGDVPLVNISVIGKFPANGLIHCTLNEAIADDNTRYGYGYTALPITIREINPFMNPAGGLFPPPTDINGDGLYEDVNGNHRLDFNDIVIYAKSISFIIDNQPVFPFDYDMNGVINLNDVVKLFQITLK